MENQYINLSQCIVVHGERLETTSEGTTYVCPKEGLEIITPSGVVNSWRE